MLKGTKKEEKQEDKEEEHQDEEEEQEEEDKSRNSSSSTAAAIHIPRGGNFLNEIFSVLLQDKTDTSVQKYQQLRLNPSRMEANMTK